MPPSSARNTFQAECFRFRSVVPSCPCSSSLSAPSALTIGIGYVHQLRRSNCKTSNTHHTLRPTMSTAFAWTPLDTTNRRIRWCPHSIPTASSLPKSAMGNMSKRASSEDTSPPQCSSHDLVPRSSRLWHAASALISAARPGYFTMATPLYG
eukprot:9492090-Pyramimonas_sp.AAC.1